MTLYIILACILFCLVLYCSSVEYKTDINKFGIGKTLVLLFLSATISLGGIRWETGTDWKSYHDFFYSSVSLSEYIVNNSAGLEILYVLLNYIVRIFTSHYNVFLFAWSFLVITISYRAFIKISSNPMLSYYLLFCTTIGGMFPSRQTLATAIGLSSIYFIHNKKKAAFIIITLLACGFHISMLVWFVAYPIYHHKKINDQKIIFIFILSVLIGIFGSNFIIHLIRIIIVDRKMAGHIAGRLVSYILDNNKSERFFSFYRMIGVIAKKAIFIPLIIFFYRSIVKKNMYMPGLINLYLVGNVIALILGFSPQFSIVTRITSSFLLIEPLILSSMIFITKKVYFRYLLIIMIFVLGLIKLYVAIDTFPSAFIPYRSIF